MAKKTSIDEFPPQVRAMFNTVVTVHGGKLSQFRVSQLNFYGRPGLNGMVTVYCVPSGVALTYTETGNSEWLSAFRTDLQAGRFTALAQAA